MATKILRRVLLVLAFAGTVLAALPAFSGNTWWIRYLDFPRLEFLIANVVIWLALLALPKSWLSWTALVFLGGAVAYDAVVLFPYTTIEQPEQLATAACPAYRRLRVLEANVQMTNQHDHRLLRMVQNVKPDIAWFQEVDIDPADV